MSSVEPALPLQVKCPEKYPPTLPGPIALLTPRYVHCTPLDVDHTPLDVQCTCCALYLPYHTRTHTHAHAHNLPLISNQHDDHLRTGVCLGIVEPCCEVLKGLPPGDVVHQQSTSRPSVVRACNGSKGLLASL